MTAAPTPASDCVFCDARDSRDHALVLLRGRHCFVILNLYPYNNGHLMVVPNRHASALEALEEPERNELMALTCLAEVALTEAYHPQGMNIGINLGKAAGAGIETHLHVHAVPRWSGDTNFMSAIGETRVLPEDLQETAARLRPIFGKLVGAEGS